MYLCKYLFLSYSKQGIVDAIMNENEDNGDKALETMRESIRLLTIEVKKLADQTRENKVMLNALVEKNEIYMDEL